MPELNHYELDMLREERWRSLHNPRVGTARLRSLNTDNVRDIERVIDLYRRVYANSYPFPRVYSPLFWEHQLCSDQRPFLHIIADDGCRFAAHLGIKCDPSRRSGEIIFVAVDPECREHIFAITRAAWRLLEEQARRQGWRSLVYFCPAVHPGNQLLAGKCFGALETAVLPGFFPAADGQTGRWTSVLGMGSVFSVEPETEIYPPTPHAGMVRMLLSPFALQGGAPIGGGSQPESSAAGLRLEYLRRLNLCLVHVRPSLLTAGQAQQLANLKHAKTDRFCVLVLLQDPQCPEICAAVEAAGYRFCGVMPPAGSENYIAYWRFENKDLARLSLYSPRAKALAAHMQERTLP